MRLAAAALCLAAVTVPNDPGAGTPGSPDASTFFPHRTGLVRIYEGRLNAAGDGPRAGASCEVIESTAQILREACTMIVGRRARPTTRITYELRKDGVYNVAARTEGVDAGVRLDRLVLPNGLRAGTTWTTDDVVRRVKTAGKPCKAAGRAFADCLVLDVTRKSEKATRTSEVYARGLGLVEDAQWQLVDVKGL